MRNFMRNWRAPLFHILDAGPADGPRLRLMAVRLLSGYAAPDEDSIAELRLHDEHLVVEEDRVRRAEDAQRPRLPSADVATLASHFSHAVRSRRIRKPCCRNMRAWRARLAPGSIRVVPAGHAEQTSASRR